MQQAALRYCLALHTVLYRNSPLLKLYLFLRKKLINRHWWAENARKLVQRLFPWLYEIGQIEKACERGATTLAHAQVA